MLLFRRVIEQEINVQRDSSIFAGWIVFWYIMYFMFMCDDTRQHDGFNSQGPKRIK